MSLLPAKSTLAKIGDFFSRLPANINKVKTAVKTAEDIANALKSKGSSALPSTQDINQAVKGAKNVEIAAFVMVGLLILVFIMVARKG